MKWYKELKKWHIAVVYRRGTFRLSLEVHWEYGWMIYIGAGPIEITLLRKDKYDEKSE